MQFELVFIFLLIYSIRIKCIRIGIIRNMSLTGENGLKKNATSCNECACLLVMNTNFVSLNCYLLNTSCEVFSSYNTTIDYRVQPDSNSAFYFLQLPRSFTMMTTESTEMTTTQITGIKLLTTKNETVYGVWNTTIGSDSNPSTVGTGIGNYYTGQMPSCAFDNNTTTKYTSFGACPLAGPSSVACGLNTDLYLTPQRGPSLLLALQFCTAFDLPTRDPLIITIEGSNQSSLLLPIGSSWILIYNDSSGLQPITGREICGTVQSVPNNFIWYSSYRILVASKRGADIATQYSELKLMGYQ